MHEHFGKLEQTKPLRISATPEKIGKYEFLRAKAPVIGLCWEAAEWEMQNKCRRLDSQEIDRIVSGIPHVQWVNLQFQQTHPKMTNVGFETWEDTAGLVHNLDAVVSCDTSVPHFSGSMGKKTIVLHGRAQTSITQYQPFESLYRESVKMFTPEYGHPSFSKTATDKFLDYVSQYPEFWNF